MVGGRQQISSLLQHGPRFHNSNSVFVTDDEPIQDLAALQRRDSVANGSLQGDAIPEDPALDEIGIEGVESQPCDDQRVTTTQRNEEIVSPLQSNDEDIGPEMDHFQDRSNGELPLTFDTAHELQAPPSTTHPTTVLTHGMFPKMKERISKLMSWATMYAIVTTTGTQRMTVMWYDYMVDTIRYLRPDVSLPLYRTVRDRIHPSLINNGFPNSHIVRFRSSLPPSIIDATGDEENHSLSRNATHGRNQALGNCKGKDSARVILPSEWAKMDVLSIHYYEDLVRSRTPDDGPDIYSSPMVKMRICMVYMSNQFQVEDGTCHGRAWPEDDVAFRVIGFPTDSSVTENVTETWRVMSIGDDADTMVVEGKVGPVWTVTAGEPTDDVVLKIIDSQRNGTCNAMEKRVLGYLAAGVGTVRIRVTQSSRVRAGGRRSRHRRIEKTTEKAVAIVVPGDVCAFVRPTTADVGSHSTPVTDLICLYVARFRPGNGGPERERLVWVTLGEWRVEDQGGEEVTVYMSMHSSCVVARSPRMLSRSDTHQSFIDSSKQLRRSGILEDGRRFVVYPIMLYHDDFHTSSLLFGHSSVGGCYMMPMGFSNELRCSTSAVRPISLTPTGLSSKEILKFIVADIVKSATEGVKGIDPYGNPVQIFIDPIGFMADYPAVSSVLDVKAHTADAPCPLCSFRRKKDVVGSDYAYSADVNSARTGNVRFAERSYAVRHTGIDAQSAKDMGMKMGDIGVVHDSPLHLLHRGLQAERHKVPKTDAGDFVVSAYFDPYLNAAVAPDHALMGIAKNLLEFFFKCLRDEKKREVVDTQVTVYLTANGLPPQRSVYNKSTGGVHTMSMTSVFSVLMVINAIADQYLNNSDLHRRCRELLISLQYLMSAAYWWPRVSVDGPMAMPYTGEGGNSRHVAELKKAVTDYVSKLHDARTHFREETAVLDKPNVHRVVELFFHTVPMFGHIGNVCEMSLESYHQVLKCGLRNNTHSDKHITAVEHALSQDWQRRLYDFHEIIEENEDDAPGALRGMLRLVAGEEAAFLPTDNREYSQLIALVKSKICTDWISPIARHFDSQRSFKRNHSARQRLWRGFGKGNSLYEHEMAEAIRLLQENNPEVLQDGVVVTEYSHAAYSFKVRKGERMPVYGHNRIREDSVVSVVVETACATNRFVEWSDAQCNTSLELFAVGGIIGCSDGSDLWAVCRHMKVVDSSRSLRKVWTADVSQTQLLKLTKDVRRGAAFHNCTKDCNIDTTAKDVVHECTVFGGGMYKIVQRHEGYPPRMA